MDETNEISGFFDVVEELDGIIASLENESDVILDLDEGADLDD
ncbi:MAG: hypothetical protein OSJ65_05355 [Bacilli bacterium]|nr:hypothetical protein [Bacilli bacterium]